jgi:hypothetical protein
MAGGVNNHQDKVKRVITMAATSSCAPGIAPTKINGTIHSTCFDENSLITLAKAYNTYITNDKTHKKTDLIKIEDFSKTSEGNRIGSLWKSLREKIKECHGHDESCIIESEIIDYIPEDSVIQLITQETFKPKRPPGETQWLSNLDISAVMQQYEKIFPQFAYYGPFPSDIGDKKIAKRFGLEVNTYADMIYGGKKKIVGITFNTDPSTRGGAHWVSLVITPNGENVNFDYYDSVGKYPNAGINDFIGKLIKSCKASNLHKNIKISINRTDHQQGNTECGMYSIHYILSRLHGETFEDFVKEFIPDKTMIAARNVYFDGSSRIAASHDQG